MLQNQNDTAPSQILAESEQHPHFQLPRKPKVAMLLTFIGWAICLIGIVMGAWMITSPAAIAAPVVFGNIISIMTASLFFIAAGSTLDYLNRTALAIEHLASNRRTGEHIEANNPSTQQKA